MLIVTCVMDVGIDGLSSAMCHCCDSSVLCAETPERMSQPTDIDVYHIYSSLRVQHQPVQHKTCHTLAHMLLYISFVNLRGACFIKRKQSPWHFNWYSVQVIIFRLSVHTGTIKQFSWEFFFINVRYHNTWRFHWFKNVCICILFYFIVQAVTHVISWLHSLRCIGIKSTHTNWLLPT